jgi:hypothetical protein
VRLSGDGAEHRQSLSRHLDAVLPEEFSGVRGHADSIDRILE